MANILCNMCKEMKPKSAFWVDRQNGSRGRFGKCKSCAQSIRPDRSLDSPTSLDILLKLPNSYRCGIDIVEARRLLSAYVYAKENRKDLSKIVVERKINRKKSSVLTFIGELKKAAKQNMTLEDYFAKGRPFKPHYERRVLVKAKKEHK